jgi:hypothetical protein
MKKVVLSLTLAVLLVAMLAAPAFAETSFTAFLAANEQSWQYFVDTADNYNGATFNTRNIAADGTYTLTLEWDGPGGDAGWLGIKTSLPTNAYDHITLTITGVRFDGAAASLSGGSGLIVDGGTVRADVYNTWEKPRNIVDEAVAAGFTKVEVTFTVSGTGVEGGGSSAKTNDTVMIGLALLALGLGGLGAFVLRRKIAA